jgi:hypothetical protein
MLSALLSILSVQAIGSSSGFATTKGTEILDAKGRPLIMKGINLGNWLIPEGYMFQFKTIAAPKQINEVVNELLGPEDAKAFWEQYLDNYITEADIKYLKSIGVNSIRLPFHYKLFTNEDYLSSNDENRGFKYLDSVVKWSKKVGIYVLLDMHCAPGGQTGDNIDDSYGYPFLYQSEQMQLQTEKIWVKIATHYQNEPTVIGYDLLNEPIAHYFDIAKINPYLEPLYKRLTKAVRTVDKNHIIFLGGAQWDGNFKIFNQPFDDKLVYTFHKYWSDTTVSAIQEYLDFRTKYNVPIYIGETGENTDEWIQSFRVLLDKNHIGWHFWPYKKMFSTRNLITFNLPKGYDFIVNYAESPRESFEKIRKLAPEDRANIKATLFELINNAKFQNCKPNAGYLNALGLSGNSK